ncbi:IS91 family transposase [Hydrocarboniphaga sp.]|uniref:IS91 family transposase n=1 Tax=Hydrocarboniphaga sp. TaxID=2033016 RepID=UPI003D14E02D
MAASARPTLAQIVTLHADACAEQYGLSASQRKVCRAIRSCRTAALGGQLQACEDCGTVRYVYHSCRNRHCPRCQTRAKERWIDARVTELLPVPYFHLVFTLPHALHRLLPQQTRWIYDTLFRCASQTLLAFGRDPSRLNGTLGITLVLHTWAQDLSRHIHVHGVVTGGALTADGRWAGSKTSFLFPVRALSKVFRGKYLEALREAHDTGAFRDSTWTQDDARWTAFVDELQKPEWVVYAKPPFGGPEQVIAYLGRYTHRIAISEQRLIDVNDRQVRFRVRRGQDRSERKALTLPGAEFLRRYLLHVLPLGFQRLRHYGLTASRCKQDKLAMCRQQLQVSAPPAKPAESVEAFWLRVAQIDIRRCPDCGGLLQLSASLPPARGPP